MIKAREVRERLQGRVDPQVIYCIESVIEQQNVLREQLMDMAQMLDQVINIVGNFSEIAEGMTAVHNKMLGKEHDTDDLN